MNEELEIEFLGHTFTPWNLFDKQKFLQLVSDETGRTVLEASEYPLGNYVVLFAEGKDISDVFLLSKKERFLDDFSDRYVEAERKLKL